MIWAVGLSAPICLTHTASSQLIRPDSASATSEFNSSYRVLNAINGSGLPAGFTPDSPHATYTTNNHWTTRSGDTIGESATFGFNQPVTLGGFHMWAHRSNNIATNPNYAVTRFDLIFRDGGGVQLGALTGLQGQPGITAAQTYAFPILSGVRSVEFIVRATANNNSSPYTGLAEVAFAECVGATAPTPESQSTCRGGTATFTMSAGGSGPFQHRWQVQDPGTGEWVATPEGEYAPLGLAFSGGQTPSLTVHAFNSEGVPAANRAMVRCEVTNACGGAVSGLTTLSVCACLECPADFNEDGGIDGSDVDRFFAAWEAGDCDADVNSDGGVDGSDVDTFFAAWEAGGCG